MILKNIWSLFYLILLISLIFLGFFLNNLHKNIYKDFIKTQENINILNFESINHSLKQHETILSILGSDYLIHKKNNSLDLFMKNFSVMKQSMRGIEAIILIDKNGSIIPQSDTENIFKGMKKLLENPYTKQSFLQTLKENKIVLGRTYFQKNLKKLIVPIRKAIRNNDNEIEIIVSILIDLEKGFDFLINKQRKNLLHETLIFRDTDYYMQIHGKEEYNNIHMYDYQFDKKLIDKELKITQEVTGLKIRDIKNKQLVTTRLFSNDGKLRTNTYLKDYKLWIVTQIDLNIINKVFYKLAILSIIIYLLVLFLVYTLFKIIINKEKQKQKELIYTANHDYVTGLYNRFYLNNFYKKDHENEKFHLLYIDMDEFKKINDIYGHNYGDNILKEIGLRLISIKKQQDTIIRYSGDEFLFFTDIKEKENIIKLAKKILTTLSKPYVIGKLKINLTSSIAISQYPQDNKDITELKQCVDIAMAEVKKKKNTYIFYTSEQKEKAYKKTIMNEQLKDSIINNEITLNYQVQVNKNEEVEGVEALVRWNNKKLGFVPPDIFINLAEKNGFIIRLGYFIIETVFNDMKQIHEKYMKIDFSINISAKQFLEDDFVDIFLYLVEKFKIDKKTITLEITENVFINKPELIIEKFNKLKKENIKISLDDFGTGYSSLNMLTKLPIDELKVDKSFVDNVLNDVNSYNMISSIFDLSSKLNLKTVAEGVENEKQKNLLLDLGCDLIQGYYYSRPLSLKDLKLYLKKK